MKCLRVTLIAVALLALPFVAGAAQTRTQTRTQARSETTTCAIRSGWARRTARAPSESGAASIAGHRSRG